MPIIGVIENMAGLACDCGRVHEVFGKGGGAELAEDLGIPLIASIPLDPEVVPGGDHGAPVVISGTGSPAGAALRAAAEDMVRLLPPADLETCTGRIAKMLTELEGLPT
jgi:ATP-binding protein involved in chromosome partitioning